MATADQPLTPEEKDRALPYVTNRWSRRIVQPLLISGMVTAFYTAFFVIAQIFVPDQPVMWLVPLVLLATLEGIYTMLWLHQPDQRRLNRLAYRGAEVMLIFLVVRVYTWVLFNTWPDFTRILDYLRSPGLILLGADNIGTLVVVLLAWGMALSTAALFKELAISEWEARYFLMPKKERLEDQRPFQYNRLKLIEGFYVQWLWGGGLLLLFTAMSTIDLPTATRDFTLNVSRLGLSPAMLFALIIYFLAGLLLVSQGRLTAKTARWLRQETEKRMEVEESWYRNSFWLVVGAALLTAFVPIGSTTPIGRLLSIVLERLIALMSAFFFLIIALLSLLFSSSDQATEEAATAVPTMMPTPLPTPVPPAASQNSSEIFEFIFSSAVWAVFLVFAVIAVLFFIRERRISVKGDSVQTLWQRLVLWFQSRWGKLRTQVETLQRSFAQRQAGTTKEKGNARSLPFNFIRVNGLLPREQIKYFYLSTLQRAEEKGVGRQESLTPEEFKETLLREFPDSEEEIEQLTAAFQEARYSKKAFDNDDVKPVKERWKQLRGDIRRKRTPPGG